MDPYHMNTKIDNELIQKVKEHLTDTKQTGTSGEYVADCPFCGHKSKDGKFCFNDQKGLWKCHSGKCGKEGNAFDLAKHFGIPTNENGKHIKPSWIYQDEKGNLISGIKRYTKKGDKQYARLHTLDNGITWKYGKGNTKDYLYRVPEIKGTSNIIIVEGEKCVDCINQIIPKDKQKDYIATTNIGGAGRWKDDYNQYLKGKNVFIIPDNDSPGREHANKIYWSLKGSGIESKVIELPNIDSLKTKAGTGNENKADIDDWFKSEHTIDDLFGLTNSINGHLPTWIQNNMESENKQAEAKLNDQQKILSERLLDCCQREQDGDANLFTDIHRDHFIFDHTAGKWYEWQKHYWKEDVTDRAIRAFDSVISAYEREYLKYSTESLESAKKGDKEGEKENEAIRKAYKRKVVILQKKEWKRDVLYLAAVDGRLSMVGDEWDKDHYLLGCQNGVIEFKTGAFRSGKQSDFIKTLTNVTWEGIDVKAPTWEEYLNSLFDSNRKLIAYLQRLLGYAITGLTTEHILPILWGKSRNGKGTLLETLSYVLGNLCCSIKAELFLKQDRIRSSASPDPDIMALQGKRIVWASETEEDRRLNEGKVKWLVGGDTLVGRAPFGKRELNFEPTHTMFLITNYKPKINPHDEAIWDRIILFPFQYKFVDKPSKPNEKKRDPNLREKLKNEVPGILAWLVKGYLEWQKHGLGDMPEEVKIATQQYREEEDVIGHFLNETCGLGRNYEVKAGELFQAYIDWCKENGYKPESGAKFGEKMKEEFEWKKTKSGNIFFGIRLASKSN